MKDSISVERLNKLHPKVRNTFKSFIEECENTYNTAFRIAQGLRTIETRSGSLLSLGLVILITCFLPII